MPEPTFYLPSSEGIADSACYKLRVLSGALQGREFPLMPGAWIIGGPDADLAVVLEGCASATLHIDASGIRLRGDIKCWVRGKAYPVSGVLPLEEPIDLAGFHIVLGSVESSNLDGIEAVDRRIPIQRLGSGGLAGALLLAGAALGAIVMFIPRTAQINEANARSAWLMQVKQALVDQHIQIHVTKDGVLELSGSCTDSPRLDKIRDELREHRVTYADNVVCTSDVVRQIEDTLALYGYNSATVRPASAPGSYDIVGAIRNDAAWSTVEEQLRHIAGVSSWTVHDALGPYSADIVNAIRRAGLGPYVTVGTTGESISIAGQLSEDRQAILDQLLMRFRNVDNRSISIQYDGISTDSVASKVLDAPIVTYIGNAVSPSVELANSVILRNGSVTAAGYTVLLLDADGIDLIRNGRVTHLPSVIPSISTASTTSIQAGIGHATRHTNGNARAGVLDLP